MITGHSRSGNMNTGDFVPRYLIGCVQLRQWVYFWVIFFIFIYLLLFLLLLLLLFFFLFSIHLFVSKKNRELKRNISSFHPPLSYLDLPDSLQDMAPVDSVAAAVVALADVTFASGTVFTLCAPRMQSFREIGAVSGSALI